MPTLGERLNEKLWRLAAILFLVYALVAGFGPVMDNVDLGWHVAQGRWIVQHGAFYRHDVFNYPNLGHAVIDEYPLFQVILYAAWSLGWWGPCALTAIVYVALATVFLHASRKADPIVSTLFLAALGMAFLFLQIGTLLRPHMVTYLCIAVLGTFLLRHRNAATWTEFWPMALLQIAWTNCHSGFVIGPAMVGLFGAEATLRRALSDKTIPWKTFRIWLAAFALILLTCFINPDGYARFYPPLLQEHLESIRAYVGEMEPLPGASSSVFVALACFAALLVLVLAIPRLGGIAISFVLFAALFYWEAQSARKAWPVFGLFLPLIVASAGAFGRTRRISHYAGWMALLGLNFAVACFTASAVLSRTTSIPNEWHQVAAGRSELSLEAVAWMKSHHIEGRLFHRCEDGGLLQMEGFDHTFSDTGFGKFDEAFIHETGLVNERPPLIPRFLDAYKPDYVVCGNFCFQWPYYLRTGDWRLIFYSPNSSVWTRADVRPDLPTVGNGVISTFQTDRYDNGPASPTLFGRDLIAFHSLGFSDIAVNVLLQTEDRANVPWVWEAARIMSFDTPPLTEVQRQPLLQIAETEPQNHPVTREFRAYSAQADPTKAKQILLSFPRYPLRNAEARLLLRIELGQNDPAALVFARRTDCFDLRDGKHWQYLAEAEERWGSLDAARAAWEKAVFYYPDDAELMKAATDFAAKHNDAELTQAIADSGKVYGK